LRCIFRERAGISLYDALHESTPDSNAFYFSRDTITKVAKVLARFRSICDSYGVQEKNILVFATEAMRTAKNKDEMLQEIRQASGMKVEILSPPMESLFGALGARSGFEHVDGLFMDLGGGSVQMTYVDSNSVPEYYTLAAEAAKSLPFGAAKLTEALKGETTALSAKLDLNTGMKQTFQGLKQRFPQLKDQVCTVLPKQTSPNPGLCRSFTKFDTSRIRDSEQLITLFIVQIKGRYHNLPLRWRISRIRQHADVH
jgi:retrograde regulation protein 2